MRLRTTCSVLAATAATSIALAPRRCTKPSSARSPVRILPRRPARLHTARAGGATPPTRQRAALVGHAPDLR